MDENCLVVKDTFLIKKMDFGKGALSPYYIVPITPLKHGVVNMVKVGVYPDAWCGKEDMKLMDMSQCE